MTKRNGRTADRADDQRAVGYIRVSTREQAMPDRPSLKQQRERIEAQCVAQGFDLVEVYQDVTSGAKWERPGLQAMLAAAKTAAFSRVVFLKIDRLGRNLKDLLEIAERLRGLDVDLVSVLENFDTRTAPGRMFFHLLGAFAEFERDRISERSEDGRRGKVAGGTYLASVPPYGYRRTGKEIAPDKVEAAVVRRMYRWALTDGINAIADRLVAEGVEPRRAMSKHFGHDPEGCSEAHFKVTPWHASAVRRILTSPRYIGEARYAGALAMPCPPLVTAEAFYAVQRALAQRKRLATGKPRDDLLRGLVRCRRCGAAAQGKSDKGAAFYICGRRRHYAGARAEHAGVQRRWPGAEVDASVRNWVADLLSDPQAALERARLSVEESAAEQRERAGAKASAQRALDGLSREQARVVQAYAQERITEEQLTEQLARIRGKQEELAALLAEPESADGEALRALVAEVVAYYVDGAADVVDWGEAGVAARPYRDAFAAALKARGVTDRESDLIRATVRAVWLEDDGSVSVDGVLGAPAGALVSPLPA
jgi:site-specific DNA recombinase